MHNQGIWGEYRFIDPCKTSNIVNILCVCVCERERERMRYSHSDGILVENLNSFVVLDPKCITAYNWGSWVDYKSTDPSRGSNIVYIF